MAYKCHNFCNGDVLSAEQVNDIEQGIVDLENSVILHNAAQNLPEEKKAQARENIGISNDPDVHSKYFTITDDGVVSLKPEYQADGKNNAELPKHLVIPEVVDELAVTELAPGMFESNEAVVSITLPNIITTIPERFCDNAKNLRKVYNTEYILSVGECAFQKTSIEKAVFPSLISLGNMAFTGCPFLVYVDIGKVAEIGSRMFYLCTRLSRLKGCAGVTSIGDLAFAKTYRLYNIDTLDNVTSIGANAFLRSGLDYNWQSLKDKGCAFGTNATALQLNPDKFWKGGAVTFGQGGINLPTVTDNRLRTEYFIDVDGLVGVAVEEPYEYACYFYESADVGTLITNTNGFVQSVDIAGYVADNPNISKIRLLARRKDNAPITPADAVGKYWLEYDFEPCENPVPTLLSQLDERWATRLIPGTDIPYNRGCAWFTIMHIYCALNNITLTSVEEFEDICNSQYPGTINKFTKEYDETAEILRDFGFNVTVLNTTTAPGTTTKSANEILRTVRDTLANGGYAYALARGSDVEGAFGTHANMAYGVNTKGKLLYADSSDPGAEDFMSGKSVLKYAMPVQNSVKMDATNAVFIVVTKN